MWTPQGIGAGRARLYALEGIIKQAIPDLNLACLACNETHDLVAMPDDGFGPLDPSKCVRIGDMEVLPPITEGFIQVRITAGSNHREGLDTYSERAWIAGATKDTLHTGILIYIHPASFRGVDKHVQSYNREITQALLSDWMRARILNFVGNLPTTGQFVDWRTLTLKSNERTQLPDYDLLSECIGVTGSTGYFTRNYGDEVAYGIQFLHTGVLNA